MKRGNWIAGFLLILLAAAVWIGAAGFPPESSFFPRVLAIIIIILTAVMLTETVQNTTDETVFDWKEANYARTAIIFIITSLYSYLLGYFGFIILTPLGLIAMMLVMERGSVVNKVIASVLTTGCIYLVFEVLLDVPLPAWSF